MKAGIIVLITAALFVVALALGAQNDQVVSVNFLVAVLELRLSWLMSGAFISGFILAALAVIVFYSKTKLYAARLKRRVHKQEQEIAKLRNQLAGE